MDLEDDPSTTDEDESADNDGKVLAQKVLHSIVALEDIEDVCGIEDDGGFTTSMSVNIDTCDVSGLFSRQVLTGLSFTYTVTATELTKVGVTNSYMLNDIEGATNVTVTAQAKRGTENHGAEFNSTSFAITGTVGRSSDGADVQEAMASANPLALGETEETLDVGSWFVLADQTLQGNEVRFTSSSSSNLEDDLDVTTVFSPFDHDNDPNTPDRTAGVYADLEVKPSARVPVRSRLA